MTDFKRGQQIIKISGDNSKVVTYIRKVGKAQALVINDQGLIELAFIWELKRSEKYGTDNDPSDADESGSQDTSNPDDAFDRTG
jgi:hypothetical protein